MHTVGCLSTLVALTEEPSTKQEEHFGSRGEDRPSASTSGKKTEMKEEEEVEYYDEIYFDSSSDEGGAGDGKVIVGAKRKQKKKFRKLTNDELFYDPHMDEEDEKWVTRQRMAYHNGEKCLYLYR